MTFPKFFFHFFENLKTGMCKTFGKIVGRICLHGNFAGTFCLSNEKVVNLHIKMMVFMKKSDKSQKKPMYIASCSFGKDSIATILLALEHNEPLDRVVFAEVMFDHERGISGEVPEHVEWIYNVAIPRLESMGVKVDVVRAKKDYCQLCCQILKSGKNAGKCYGVQNSKPCYANSDLKIAPIRQYLRKVGKEFDIVQYVGIAADEPIRLERIRGTNKVSLLEKYGYTEHDAMDKCKEYNLVSPLYSMGYRGGCWFCFNANIERFIHIRKEYPDYWRQFNDLYYNTKSTTFKYNKPLYDIEKEMDAKEWMDSQPTLFDL